MQYAGHAFHKEFKNGRMSGLLTISGPDISFTSAAGRIAVPLTGAVISRGGASNRLVFISHPAYPEYSFYTSDQTILNDPLFKASDAMGRQIEEITARRLRHRLMTAGIAVCLLLLCLCPFIFVKQIVRGAARQVPAGFERQIGEKLFAQYQFQNDIMEEKEGQAALQEVTAALLGRIDTTQYPFKVYVSKDPGINAFALPGGFIVVNSGLIQAARTPEELLGVIAHEIIHVTEQHGLRNLISSASILLIVQAFVGDAAGVMATIASAAPLLLNQHYSRDFEREADEKGCHLLLAARINPEGMLRFFQRLREEETKMLQKLDNETAAGVLKTTQKILGSHPDTEERIKRLEGLVSGRSGEYRDLSRPFARLKSVVAGYVSKSH